MNELLYVYHTVYPLFFSSFLFSSLFHCHIVIDCRCILNLLSHIILFHITVKTLSVEGKVGKVSEGNIPYLLEMFADNIDDETMARDLLTD